MQYLKTLEPFELYDLLAAHTSKYTKMLSTGIFNDEDFSHTREMIEKIQAEIQTRDPKANNETDGFLDGQSTAVA
jgi:hypothetical protein